MRWKLRLRNSGRSLTRGKGSLELDKFDNLFRNMSEAYFGIPERVRNYLGDIDKTLSECRFDLATVRAEDAKRLMETYCTSKGTAYRKLEKEVRCYRERNSRILQLQRRGGPQSDRLLVMQEKLNIFRNGMLRDLNLFTSIKEADAYVNTRKTAFDVRQREYKAAADFALERLRDKDQENACEMVRKLREIGKGCCKAGPRNAGTGSACRSAGGLRETNTRKF